MSLKDRIAASKKESTPSNATPDAPPSEAPVPSQSPISVAALAKECGFKTAAALIDAVKEQVSIKNARAKLDTDTIQKIREITQT